LSLLCENEKIIIASTPCRNSQICADIKKPNGQFFLSPNREDVLGFLKDLPVRKIPGIGKVSEQLLAALDIKTCGEMVFSKTNFPISDNLLSLFGSTSHNI